MAIGLTKLLCMLSGHRLQRAGYLAVCRCRYEAR